VCPFKCKWAAAPAPFPEEGGAQQQQSWRISRSQNEESVQPYIVQTGVDTDGETQEEVTTFRMKLDVSEWLVDKFM